MLSAARLMRKFNARFAPSEAINLDLRILFKLKADRDHYDAYVLKLMALSFTSRVFQSSDPTRVSGGSCLIRRRIAFITTTVHRRKPSGTSHKIVISSRWPNCRFSNKTPNRHRTNPKMHRKRSNSD